MQLQVYASKYAKLVKNGHFGGNHKYAMHDRCSNVLHIVVIKHTHETNSFAPPFLAVHIERKGQQGNFCKAQCPGTSQGWDA